MFDLQKASVFKRISAFILDAIILCIVATGAIWGISAITGYDGISDTYNARLEFYETQYGITFDIGTDAYAALTDTERTAYDTAYEAFISDDTAMTMYSKIVTLTFMMTALGLFLAFFICEFIVPLVLGNGMTVGKKVFSIAVMHRNQTRIRPVTLFVRSILGKYAVETMIPVCIALLTWFNVIAVGEALAFIGLMAAVQLLCISIGKTNPLVHDGMAWTVAVDFDSQMIYDDEAALMKAKQEFYAQEANNDRTY